MGSWFSRRPEARIIIQGLDAAGKTSLLYRLKLGEVVTTIPTIGFNVETITLKGISITCWDVGGRDKIRPLYRHYYQGASGLIFVIDSNDRERLEEALDELVRYVLLEDELQQTVVMVLANKQDLPQAVPASHIEKVLETKFTFTADCKHSAFVLPCSVLTGDNLEMAMTYFGQQLRLRPQDRQTGLYRPNLDKPDTPALTTHSAFKSVVRNPLAALKALFY